LKKSNAIKYGHLNIVNQLIDVSANIHILNEDPLRNDARHGYANIVD
jgi:low temperature requirement protein LtrA